MRCSRTALLGLLLLAINLPSISAFVPPHLARTSNTFPLSQCLQQQSLKKNDHQEGQDGTRSTSGKEGARFTAHVVASDALILPGEGMTLFLENKEALPLVQSCLNGGPDCEFRREIVVAVRLMTGELQLAPVASLCEISEVNFGSRHDYIQVDLRCTGQVRLEEMTQQYSDSHFEFRAERVDATFEDETELDKAICIEQTIESLMKTVSSLEQEIEQELCEQQRQSESHALRPRTCFLPPVLYDQYEAAKRNVERCLTSSSTKEERFDNDEDMLRLTATSWGVFHCLNDPKLEARYRPRALVDRENLLERIKMAQHALREKKVHLQGRLMQLQDDSEASEDYFEDLGAFQ